VNNSALVDSYDTITQGASNLFSLSINTTCVHETLGTIKVINVTTETYLSFRAEHYCNTLQQTINSMFSMQLPLRNIDITNLQNNFSGQPLSSQLGLILQQEENN